LRSKDSKSRIVENFSEYNGFKIEKVIGSITLGKTPTTSKKSNRLDIPGNSSREREGETPQPEEKLLKVVSTPVLPLRQRHQEEDEDSPGEQQDGM
jgi:hypothetical protein